MTSKMRCVGNRRHMICRPQATQIKYKCPGSVNICKNHSLCYFTFRSIVHTCWFWVFCSKQEFRKISTKYFYINLFYLFYVIFLKNYKEKRPITCPHVPPKAAPHACMHSLFWRVFFMHLSSFSITIFALLIRL